MRATTFVPEITKLGDKNEIMRNEVRGKTQFTVSRTVVQMLRVCDDVRVAPPGQLCHSLFEHWGRNAIGVFRKAESSVLQRKRRTVLGSSVFREGKYIRVVDRFLGSAVRGFDESDELRDYRGYVPKLPMRRHLQIRVDVVN